MKIAYNPKTAAALTTAPANNDITFDLSGLSIYIKGVRFKGTDTTYSVFKKHGSSGGGYDGLVPVPSYNNDSKTRFLREDGTWVIPTNTSYTFANGTDGSFTVTPLGGSGQKVTIGKPLTAGTADKVAKLLTLKIKTGTTEGTDLYTYDGSKAKTLDIKAGANITLTPTAGVLTISATNSNTTYTLSGALDGNTFVTTLTPSSGTTTTAVIPAMIGATSSAAGKAGLVPAPAANKHTSFLRGDGAWIIPTDTKNTAGSTNSTSKLFLIGATSQAANPQTYSNSSVYTTNGTLYATTFVGNLDGTHINKLTGYKIAEAIGSIATTDSLNTALGKLEFKTNFIYNDLFGTDKDNVINKWHEIVDFVDSVAEGTDITDEFVTRKTTLTITGSKTFTASTNIFSGTEASILTIDRNSTNPAWIKFAKNNNLLGYIGIDNNKKPVVNIDGTVYYILHSGNSFIKDGVITINGTSITPLTTHQSLANYVTLDTAQTITGVKTFAASPILNAIIPIIQKLGDSSNYTTAIKWYKGGASQGTYDPLIGLHNTGGDGKGSICILPYPTETSPWGGTVGLFISKGVLKLDGKSVALAENYYTKTESDERYVNVTGDTMTGPLIVKAAITGTQLISTIATGTSPLKVTSTTVVTNLNSDLLDGLHETSFFRARGDLSIASSVPTTTELATSNNLCGSWRVQYTGATGHLVLFNAGSGSTRYMQFYSTYSGSLYWRNSTDSTLNTKSWKTIVDSANYAGIVLKIGTATKGSATLPIYLNAGTPTACSTTLGVSITGNAATATKLLTARTINGTSFDGTANIVTAYWGTARTISLSGAVTGSASVNGSLNVTITTTYLFGSIDGRYVGGNKTANHGSSGTAYTADTYSSTFVNKAFVAFAERGSWAYANNGYVSTDTGVNIPLAGTAIFLWGASDTNKTLLYITPHNNSGVSNPAANEMLFYTSNGSGYTSAWTRVLTHRNYTNYTVTKTGGGASGTWGISITGNAATANRILSHTISDTLANKTTPGYLYHAGGSNSVADKPSGVDAFGVFTMLTASGWYGLILMSSNTSTGLYWRTATTLSGGWKKILDSSNYTAYINPANFVTALGTSGNYLTWTKNGTTNNITIPYATNSATAGKLKLVSCYNGTTNNDLWSTIKTSNSSYIGTATVYEVYNDGGPTTYGEVLDIVSIHSNHWLPQLWFDSGKTGSIRHRNKDYNNDTWGSWYVLLDNNNYAGTLDSRYVTLTTNQTVSGIKTFSTLLKFTVATGTSPFTVSSTTVVGNLNADMVDGQHFNWNNNKNDHTYLWAASSNGQAYLVHRASMSVNYANYTGYAQKLQVHDVRDATRTPNYFDGYRVTSWFNNTGTPSSGWWSGIHVKGWHDGYTSWELCSYSSTGTANNYDLYFRSGNNTTWGSWKTIINSGNYTSYTVKKDGTGASGTWGISISGNAATASNADTVDGYHASGLFTNLSNSGNNISLTVGGTNKTLTVGYADKSGLVNLVDSSAPTNLLMSSSSGYNTVKRLTGTVGGATKLMYISEGVPMASSSTVGSSTEGVYLSSGTIKKMTYSLNATVNSGNTGRLAYYSSSVAISEMTDTYGEYDRPIYIYLGKPLPVNSMKLGLHGFMFGSLVLALDSVTLTVLLVRLNQLFVVGSGKTVTLPTPSDSLVGMVLFFKSATGASYSVSCESTNLVYHNNPMSTASKTISLSSNGSAIFVCMKYSYYCRWVLFWCT